MKYIPMSVLEYSFDDNGVTERIVVAFQLYDGNAQFNARIPLTEENVKEINPNLELDKMNKQQCDNIARRILRDWTLVEPETTEETEEETAEATE